MLKSVSNAVVNYTINCFRIPKLFWLSWALFKVDIGGGHKLHDKEAFVLEDGLIFAPQFNWEDLGLDLLVN